MEATQSKQKLKKNLVQEWNEWGKIKLGTGTEDDAIVMLHFVSVRRCTKSTGDNDEDV